jgi:putative ABC transport system substrate-binding protein
VRRRAFITLLGGAAAWPVVAGAQQAGRLPTIGLLGAATSSAWNKWVAAFLKRLRELGWIEGSNIAIEYRWAEGRDDAMPRSRQSLPGSKWMSLSRPAAPSSQPRR